MSSQKAYSLVFLMLWGDQVEKPGLAFTSSRGGPSCSAGAQTGITWETGTLELSLT